MHSSFSYFGLILLVAAVVGWFAIGTQFNVRKGHKVLAWLQQGLKVLGDKTNLRWLGSAVVELKIENAKEPFRRAEVLAVLEPRDVALLWWYHHVRGRRDLLIVRGNLRRTPGFEFEALDPHGWTTRGIERQLQFRNWHPVPLSGHSSLLAYAAGPAPSASALLDSVNSQQLPLVRLAIRRTEPNLEIQWRLADAQKISSQELLQIVKRVPESLFVHR